MQLDWSLSMGHKRMPVRFQALFAFTSGDHLMARSTRDQPALQTIDSEAAFCGAANRFLQHALRGSSITAMT